jgi:hypothetical protein
MVTTIPTAAPLAATLNPSPLSATAAVLNKTAGTATSPLGSLVSPVTATTAVPDIAAATLATTATTATAATAAAAASPLLTVPSFPIPLPPKFPTLTPGVDTVVTASIPTLVVAASMTSPLGVGKQVFQLVVTDDSGNASEPALVTVIVLDTAKPTAVIDFVDPATGKRDPNPTVSFAFGSPFQLVGDRSSDIGGVVKSWTWTLLTP